MSSSVWYYCSWVFLALQALRVYGYKPVIIIHGILDNAEDLKGLEDTIKEAHPKTEVYTLDYFDDYHSFKPLWKQLEVIKNATLPIMKNATDGVHIIGYSQGGLIGRGLIQTTDEHNVDSFIALSSPLNGQYGDTSFINWLVPGRVKAEMYKFFYTTYGQLWSIGNYWKDPHHTSMYQKFSSYLAALNNESMQSNFAYPKNWAKNFEKLGNLVTVGGKDDGVITPWQSSHFSCYDEKERVVPVRNLKIYKDNVFGLKTLDKKGSFHECVMDGVKHTHWHKNVTVFNKCIKPWLT